ncbi:adenylate kinase [Schistosoma bovis]|uniref:Adenylate kinase n=1 Tax=Schistosoma bovis TaxID=6184 RepID=A0A430QCS8_SCHBO|nr:adenylate kinase [Schistosoma bovis]
MRPAKHYILAKDDSQNTLREIVKAISTSMTTGHIKSISKEEALFCRDITPIRLCILGPPASGKTTLAKKLCEYYKLPHIHIKQVIDEAIANLPIRLCILGPPASGKTTLAKKLCEYYKLPHIHIKQVIDEAIANLFPTIYYNYYVDPSTSSLSQTSKLRTSGGSGDGEEDEGEQENEEEEEEGIKAIDTNDFTQSANELFKSQYLQSEKEADDVTKELGLLSTQPIPMQLPKGLLPAYVFELQATDNFLRDRIMNMPEYKVHGTHYTESGFWRRLNEYRTNQIGINPALSPTLNIPGSPGSEPEVGQVDLNSLSPLASASIYENSVRAYFDSKGILQIPVNIMTDESEELEQTFRKLVYFIGPPRNYGLSDEEIEKQRLIVEKQRIEFERAEEERLKQEIETAEAERNQRIKEWKEKQEALEKEEKDLLNKESEPLRAYLRKHIMPVLAKGLTECVRKRPDDPLDFLKELLNFDCKRKTG